MDFSTIKELGLTGANLVVIWMIYQSAQKERTVNDQRLDKRDETMRLLEHDIRNKFSTQLMENTNTMLQHSKIMERVMDVLSKFKV